MSNDEEYREVIRRFYEVYRPLQKRHNLRLHSHFSIYDDGLIEQRSKRVCKVKEENDIDCYKRAIEALERYGKERERITYEKRAG